MYQSEQLKDRTRQFAVVVVKLLRSLPNEATYRAWRLYMSAAASQFAMGRYNVYQSLLAKPDRGKSRLPLTRADWYS